MLKDKVRHSKHFKSLFEQKLGSSIEQLERSSEEL